MTNKVILLTGATGRIGQVLVKHFLAKGDILIGTCYSNDSFDFLNRFPENGKKLFPLQVDLLSPNSIDKIFEFVEQCELQPTHIINNARSLQTMKVNAEGMVPQENFANELHLQVIVPYQLIEKAAKNWKHSLQSIVNVGSQYGVVAVHHQLSSQPGSTPTHYSVAKAALIQLTKELAVRLAPQNISVNCISLGGIEGRASQDFVERYKSLIPIQRMLSDKDIPGAFDFLTSPAASGMTGHNLVIDGGWSIV